MTTTETFFTIPSMKKPNRTGTQNFGFFPISSCIHLV